jgi:hypothetical protein
VNHVDNRNTLVPELWESSAGDYGRRERGERCGVCRVIFGNDGGHGRKDRRGSLDILKQRLLAGRPGDADDVIYWGSGYAHIKSGKPHNMVFAFAPTR